jgi:hypothetical protein
MQPLRMTRAEFRDFVHDEARSASQIIKALGSL